MRNLWRRIVALLKSEIPSDEEMELSREAQRAREHWQHEQDAKRANRKVVEELAGIARRQVRELDNRRQG